MGHLFSCSSDKKHKNINTNSNSKIKKMHMIVDDSLLNRLVLKKFLEDNNYNVIDLNSAEECLEEIKKTNNYSIIWIDIRLEQMNGIECTKILRNDLNYTNAIIGITSHVDYDSIEACKKAGMNNVIAKPIIREEIYNCAKKYELNQN